MSLLSVSCSSATRVHDPEYLQGDRTAGWITRDKGHLRSSSFAASSVVSPLMRRSPRRDGWRDGRLPARFTQLTLVTLRLYLSLLSTATPDRLNGAEMSTTRREMSASARVRAP